MTIKSDRWITTRCTPTEELVFEYRYNGEVVEQFIPYSSLCMYPEISTYLNALAIGECHNASEQMSFTRMPGISMIEPFVNRSVSAMSYRGQEIKIPSYGLSSYGYDIRLGRNYKVMNGTRNASNVVIDYAKGNQEDFFKPIIDVDAIDIVPHSFLLAVSHEKLHIPRNVIATCMGKSSVARMGLNASITPLEAGWSGYITLELKNETDHPIRLYSGMGIMQLLFHESNQQCITSYAERSGKYQNQPDQPIAAIS